MSLDGTGHFSSGKINCPSCCQKTHKNGNIEYDHQLPAAAMVNPNNNPVFPLFPEAITKQDGVSKNDCESNAAKRLLPAIRKAFPQFGFTVSEDAIGGDAPNIREIMACGYHYMITVKPDDREWLYEQARNMMNRGETDEFEVTDEYGIMRGYRFVNHVSLNKANQDISVNYLDYWEMEGDTKLYSHQRITDIELTRETVNWVMRAGRARWKAENETFNTLKNLGYNLEHNYGHGNRYLSAVFATLMMSAFPVDQVQEHACELFKAVRNAFYSRTALWEHMRGMFRTFMIKCREDFWLGIIFDWGGGE